MTQILDPPTAADVLSLPASHVPGVPPWTVARDRLFDRLDVGVSGVVTCVQGPIGSGKTTLVASWAAARSMPRLGWVSLNPVRTGDRSIATTIARALVGSGRGPRRAPRSDPYTIERIAAQLRATGPWVVVLDDFPASPADALGRELTALVEEAGRAIRLVVLCDGVPSFDLHRHRASGELTVIDAPDLVLTSEQIAGVLERHGVRADAATTHAVAANTHGWACGVRFAAMELQSQPALDVALHKATELTGNYLEHEVLGRLSGPVRELVLRTSMVDDVRPELARAVLGGEPAEGASLVDGLGSFVELRADGSFALHPLLRQAASRWAIREESAQTRAARRTAAGWYADQGDGATAVDLASAAGDWSLAADVAVESMAVPDLLVGVAGDQVTALAERDGVAATQPLLASAAAAASGRIAAAAALVAADTNASSPKSRAGTLSTVMLELVLAAAVDDVETGLTYLREGRSAVAQLPLSQRARAAELSRMMAMQEGAFALRRGDLEQAQARLSAAAGPQSAWCSASPVTADSLAQLALLEALRGHLRMANAYADAVGTVPGLMGAQEHRAVARACIQLGRDEVDLAMTTLDELGEHGLEQRGPWLATVYRLVRAQTCTASGSPEDALRQIACARNASVWGRRDWLADRLLLAQAQAHLAAGEPRAALAAITADADRSSVETVFATAESLDALGDVRGARAALGSLGPVLMAAPLNIQVRARLLIARASRETGQSGDVRRHVDWALRNTAREQDRRALLADLDWLRGYVEGDPALRREYGSFVRSLHQTSGRTDERIADISSRSGELLVDRLTEREIEVLERLAQLYSTEEIAADLFVSTNTVKSHLKSLFRKLSVNRRGDAVRRGRALGLC